MHNMTKILAASILGVPLLLISHASAATAGGGTVTSVKVMSRGGATTDLDAYFGLGGISECPEGRIGRDRTNFEQMLSVALAAHLSGKNVWIAYNPGAPCDIYGISMY